MFILYIPYLQEYPEANMTLSQEEILEEFNPEYDTYMSFSRTAMQVNFITTIMKFFIFLVVIAADLFLLVAICRNARLRCKTNSYFIHYAAFNIVAVVATPLFYILMELLNIHPMAGMFWYHCVVVQIEATALGMCFLMGVCLCLDWVFEVYNPEWKKKFQVIYNNSIVISYVICFCKVFFTMGSCFDTVGTRWFFTYFYVTILVIDVATNVLRNRLKPEPNKKSYSLNAANVIILFWIPLFLYEISWICFKRSSILEDVLTLISFIPEWIGYGSPIVLLVVLGKTSKDFKKVFIRMFKRSAKDYDEDELDESEERKPEENFAMPTDVQVL